jgi:anti-sigma regulatory factor (Ser/Thr protein kinase)
MFEEYWRLASTARLNESWCVMTERATLVLKNDVAELEKVMALVSDVCKRHSIPPETEYDLTLALDEVVTNVARHAYPQGETHQFTLKVTVSGTEFEARVEDDGVAFDPTAHPAPNLDIPLEERKEGGLGIFLVRQIMTSVEYQRVEGKNLLIIRKTLA